MALVAKGPMTRMPQPQLSLLEILEKLEEAENFGNNRKLTEAEKAKVGCSMQRG